MPSSSLRHADVGLYLLAAHRGGEQAEQDILGVGEGLCRTVVRLGLERDGVLLKLPRIGVEGEPAGGVAAKARRHAVDIALHTRVHAGGIDIGVQHCALVRHTHPVQRGSAVVHAATVAVTGVEIALKEVLTVTGDGEVDGNRLIAGAVGKSACRPRPFFVVDEDAKLLALVQGRRADAAIEDKTVLVA